MECCLTDSENILIWDGFRVKVSGADLLDINVSFYCRFFEIASGNITVFWQNNKFLFMQKELTFIRLNPLSILVYDS
ncbi:hypothetical protein XIS1_1270075 [Xenorhabdus innexi]|uniref:Uncharacterized protein n=1 Tax=Xenorhabdus innexi TaxID=290109 RepID=A0A1N6MSM6_9GAMM|nr:hypothetical protein XIS1_1270075 [Xenorhabdus innexi]